MTSAIRRKRNHDRGIQTNNITKKELHLRRFGDQTDPIIQNPKLSEKNYTYRSLRPFLADLLGFIDGRFPKKTRGTVGGIISLLLQPR